MTCRFMSGQTIARLCDDNNDACTTNPTNKKTLPSVAFPKSKSRSATWHPKHEKLICTEWQQTIITITCESENENQNLPKVLLPHTQSTHTEKCKTAFPINNHRWQKTMLHFPNHHHQNTAFHVRILTIQASNGAFALGFCSITSSWSIHLMSWKI